MTPRVAAVALAASALIAAPAAADTAKGAVLELEKHLSGGTSLSIQVGHNSHHAHRGHKHYHRAHHSRRGHGYHGNEWGQSRREVRRLKRDAVRMCRRAVRNQAYNIGFYDVDFDDDWRAHQIGPYGFRVRLDDVEFEGRRRDRERDVTCIVRRGDVRSIEGIPRSRRGYRNAGYSYGGYDAIGGYDGRYDGFTDRQWRAYDQRHRGHNHSRGDYCPLDNGYRY